VIYRNAQVGTFYFGLLAVVLVLCAFFVIDSHYSLLAITIGAILLVSGISFARLTTEVDASGVRWWMTFGFPSGHIPFEEIISAEIVSVTFLGGVGIHLTFSGWLWNVGLGNGVQIHRCDGMPVVLGTDDPQGLLAAINQGRAG
jgi:hypothetical protein